MKVGSKNKNNTRKKLFLETALALLVALSPFIFKSYEYFPDNTENFKSFLGVTFGPHGFQDISTLMWYSLSKLVPLYLLIIWFFTCKHWWYHIILIPIVMYTFQLFEMYISDSDGSATVDTDNILWILPVCIVVIPFVYFIRIKIYDKYVHGIDLDAMDQELKFLKEKEALKKEWEKLEQQKAALLKKM
jgi:glucan phosphoethanolaminetransferase (alkaline phosphatase superfamily)